MGPLDGIRVIEMAGLAPVPFAGMMLADLGADVLRIDPIGSTRYAPPPGLLDRGKACVEVNLKDAAGRDLVRELAAKADVFLEGFRPGVAERLGVGPADLCDLNTRLIYGGLTGWGQDGPLASRVGHDINYIALAGVLDIIGRPGERPVPPANLVGDFAGGGMLMAAGAVEPEFFANLTAVLGLDDGDIDFQLDPNSWPQWRTVLADKFREKTREEWAEIFTGVDACVSPVLSPWEASEHPHHAARGSFVEVGGVRQPAPAPRFSRTPAEPPAPLEVLSLQEACTRW